MTRRTNEAVIDFFSGFFTTLWCFFIIAMLAAIPYWVTLRLYSWLLDC